MPTPKTHSESAVSSNTELNPQDVSPLKPKQNLDTPSKITPPQFKPLGAIRDYFWVQMEQDDAWANHSPRF